MKSHWEGNEYYQVGARRFGDYVELDFYRRHNLHFITLPVEAARLLLDELIVTVNGFKEGSDVARESDEPASHDDSPRAVAPSTSALETTGGDP